MQTFDTIVVGKGLIGAAAAKYLALTGQRIAVIGADEPADVHSATVYASHYDQGRVQRIVGRDEVWTRLNTESASVYPQLQSETGIDFHYPVGCLYVTLHQDDAYLNMLPQQAAQFGFSYQLYADGVAVNHAYPDFVFPHEARANFEAPPSGHINPRKLIEAQLSVAATHKATVISGTVTKVYKANGLVYVETQAGETYKAGKVLLAPGAFANFLGLLNRPLALQLKSETVLLARVSEAEAERLAQLPSLLYEIETSLLEEIYLIRPLQYPDGNWYLKMGSNLTADQRFDTLSEIQQWFRNGDSDANLAVQKEALELLMPGLQVLDYVTKRCIITYTQHRKQYIGQAEEDIYVATGGNGYSAMCSDAVGRLAVHNVVYNYLPEPYNAHDFRLVWA